MSINILCENPAETIRVARFVRPDVREALDDHDEIGKTTLYKQLHAGAIAGLPHGGTVILNFGLIDLFPSAFYRLLLQTLQDMRALGGRIIVCCLTENAKEGFEMMGGAKLFEVHNTEARAIASVKK
jgi:anti-anti-sigma regulatory factor